MRSLTRRFLAMAVATTALVALGAGSAGASTFCVPTFGPNCPDSGGNVAEADLEKAMNLNGSDGVADTVVVAAGTFVEDNDYESPSGFEDFGSFEPFGSDPLTVVGAGRGATILTSGSTGNIYLVSLSGRQVTMRDLTLRMPASFPDNQGAAIQLFGGDLLERIEVVSLNVGSDGVEGAGPGNVVRDAEVRGMSGGDTDYGFSSSGSTGQLLVEDSIVRDGSWPLTASGKGTLTARRVLVESRTYGAIASSGTVVIENSVLKVDDGVGLHVGAGADDGNLIANHVTVVNSGGSDPALEGVKFSGTAGDASMIVTNSILRGFASGYETQTPFGPGIGVVSIKASYSNLPQNGTDSGGNSDLATANIDADPQFASDLSLLPGSPSIDAASPFIGLNDDFLGAPRPVDGNGDGSAIRDQGAFEYQPPAAPGVGPGGGGGGGGATDTTKPTVKGLKGPGKALADGRAKFRFRANEAGSKFVCKLDARKAAACKSPKSYSGLKPGRHSFKVWAIDPAGNKSAKPAKRKFRVPVADA